MALNKVLAGSPLAGRDRDAGPGATVALLQPADLSPGRDPAGRPPQSLGELVSARAMLSAESLARAETVARESGERLDAVFTRLGLLSEQALADALADAFALPFLPRSGFPAEAVAGPRLSRAFLHDMRCVPVRIADGHVEIATANPYDDFVEPAMRFAFDLPVRRQVALASDIDAAIERCYGEGDPGEADEGEVTGDDLDRLKDLVSDAPVIRAVNRLIAQAVDERASDIHVEPTDDSLAVRLRIDGALREMPALPASMRAPLVSRIKIMAGLNIAEKRLPQDGRLRIAVRGTEIDLRVATAPSIHGESVVMRILDRSRLALDFESLGFAPRIIARVRPAIAQPHGIMLVTGPTGSGKTTTLYAALAELNRPDRKLLTVEDPIEYRLPGIVQAQVAPAIGFTFGSALRSFLRQDPDVIMVGEIRDGETAEIAVQAALTGHMILSTLHTNTAAGAVTRLLDMGVEPFLLSSVLTAVLAQRLVRRLCPACRGDMPVEARVEAIFRDAGLEPPARLPRATGCDQCGGTGYRGRVALIEFLAIDDTVARLILERADTRDIAQAAGAAGGLETLLADGLQKVASGMTTLEEVLRTVGGSD